jgi:hypothetical protein
MKIKMLTSMAGANFALSVNEETGRFSDAEATRLIEAGYAVPVAQPKIERAVKQPAPETRGKDA